MDSKLYDAVINDNIDVLKEMEGRLSVSDQLTPTNNTVLHLACQYGSINCVEKIISVHELSLLLKINSRGETALHLAARHGHNKVVEALIGAAKSSFRQPSDLQNTSSTFVHDLIRSPDFEHETALHAAVRYQREYVVELLVIEDPSLSHLQNKHKETALYSASSRCYSNIVNTILQNCELPTFGGPDGRTALHAALMNPAGYECMKLLLDKNKDIVKVADNYGWTPFHYVAHNDLSEMVGDLAEADKSVGYLTDKEYKRTPLHVAAYKGNVGVLKKLVEYYHDCWENVDGSGQNILHIAVEHRRENVIEFILSKGFEASNNLFIQRDKEGNTPLHLIAKLESYVPKLIKKLDQEGIADWDVLNHQNLNPLEIIIGIEDQTDTLANQMMVRPLVTATVEKRRYMLRIREAVKTPEDYERVVNTHMIVAALITTVALTSGFAVPGGFDGNQGPTQGSPILLRKTAFEAFIVSDTIALLFSISSLFLNFMTKLLLFNKAGTVLNLHIASTMLNLVSIIAMMLAFIAGTYAVLADHSIALAVSVCVIASFFFLFVYSIISRLYRKGSEYF